MDKIRIRITIRISLNTTVLGINSFLPSFLSIQSQSNRVSIVPLSNPTYTQHCETYSMELQVEISRG
jgi:hypothetical protein